MHQAEIVAILLMMMAALVIIAKKLELPYPVVLVLGGLAVSFIPRLPEVHLDPNLVFFLFLPALLYPTALFTSWRDFRRNLRPILLLAIGLVLITMVAVAWVAHTLIPSLPWAAAFALGAIVSPPDAIAATAVIRRLSVPHRIQAILESESLVNDATALVALQFAIGAMMTGTFSLSHASIRFVAVGAGGVGFGLLVGFLMRAVQRRLDDPPVQITVSLLTPFLAYLPAERLHVSGVLATVAAGIYLGWHSPLVVRARYRLQAFSFWEMIGFLLNGFIFIIIGLQLPGILRAISGDSLLTLIYDALLICAAVVVARIVWVIPGVYFPRLLSKRIRAHEPKPRWQNVALVSWAGMRGVISLAAAFALPFRLPNGNPFPGRNYILFFTFCVILATLVGQGLTLPFLIRILGIKDDGATDEEERGARLAANEAAIAFLENECLKDGASPEIIRRLRAEYDDRIGQLQRCKREMAIRPGESPRRSISNCNMKRFRIERRKSFDCAINL